MLIDGIYIYIYIYNSEGVANYWVEKKQSLSSYTSVNYSRMENNNTNI